MIKNIDLKIEELKRKLKKAEEELEDCKNPWALWDWEGREKSQKKRDKLAAMLLVLEALKLAEE